MFYNDIIKWLEQNPLILEAVKIFGILFLAYIIYILSKKIIITVIEKIVSKTRNIYDDILLNETTLKRLAYIAPLLLIRQFTYYVEQAEVFLSNLIEALIVVLFLATISSLFKSFNKIYENTSKHRDRPIKGYLQIILIVIYIVGTILIIGLLTGQSPWTLLGGIGALTAVLILVFKDTILGFVASIQITSYDLVKVGDWIEVPSLGVDGDVMDIALHTIKVRNFDKTITVIPTHKLIEVSFKNWRGMQETGGRRIKRPIYIDIATVKFCDEELLNKFEKFQLISDYIKQRKAEVDKYNKEKNIDESQIINGRRMTNLGTFREYLKSYLKNRDDISKDLTFLIRQLEPGPNGLPIEIYVFATTTEWGKYEEIQSHVFDHIFAVVKEFDLAVYQNPTGNDIRNLKS
ncbi:MAG: mechanosensitive ion channel family protein [Bacteroidetes bacterium]|nr:mechanosensitive ion channel family protein [Bacteroidota bacterium]